jgi:hypothetical protein
MNTLLLILIPLIISLKIVCPTLSAIDVVDSVEVATVVAAAALAVMLLPLQLFLFLLKWVC